MLYKFHQNRSVSKLRHLLIAIVFLLICVPAPAVAGKTVGDKGENIRVLILEKGFETPPAPDEKLTKVDDIDGRLVMGYSSYLGSLSIWKGKGGLYLVNTIPLEDYVKGVVKAETGRDWAEQALKAQAVIVRTYVLKRMKAAKRPEYHVTSSVLHQVYRGLNSDLDIETAVNSTMGEILTYKGSPIEALYHSTSVGSTEFVENVFGNPFPYLKSVPSSGRLSPYAYWNRRIPLSRFSVATEIEGVTDMTIASRTKADRVDELIFTAPSGQHRIKAIDLRRKMGWKSLPSTDFTVNVDKGEALLQGKGYGHGVGLCQWTALEMAIDGKDYLEILAHFYPGTRIDIR